MNRMKKMVLALAGMAVIVAAVLFFWPRPQMEKSSDIVAKYIEALREPESGEFDTVFELLLDIGKKDSDAIFAITSNLKHEKRLVRLYCASVLGRIGPKASPAIPELVRLFLNADEDKYVRQIAANSLGLIGAESIPALTAALDSEDDFIRKNATHGLTRIQGHPEKTLPLLVRMLGDKNQDVRSVVMGSFEEAKKEVAPFLRNGLNNQNEVIRALCATILATMNEVDSSVIKALAEGADHSNADVRRYAAEGLGHVGEAGVPILIKSLADTDGLVRFAAASSLAEIGPSAKAAVPALIKALKDEDEKIRGFAAMALGKIRSEPAVVVPALIDSLKNDVFEVQIFVIDALVEFGADAKPALPELKRLGNDPTYQDNVIKALQALGG